MTMGGLLAGLVTVLAVVAITLTVDRQVLWRAVGGMVANPMPFLLGLAAFAAAFAIRAVVWRRVLPDLDFGQAWAAIHAALLGNHVLPLRLGEPLRVASIVKRAGIGLVEASASTITLRAADLVAVIGLAWILGARQITWFGSLVVQVVAIAAGVACLAGLCWTWRLREGARIHMPGAIELAGTLAAWMAEAGLVLVVARSAGLDLSLLDAVLVTSVSVAAQVVAVAPGGFGTYEVAAVAAYVFLGHDPAVALAAALVTHGLKTAYSIAVGVPALFVPTPGLLGRLRVPRDRQCRASTVIDNQEGPVVLFMPAYNEEATVGQVVRRVPNLVSGHHVVTLVIDDGSTDGTAELARRAGAEVFSSNENRGLGAAVRTGLIRSLVHDPVAVVFCDADAEYSPEEIGRLIEPILQGRADYVVGSRFLGRIERMLAHRRFGNRVLTRLLSYVARTPITDGQSGFRALSAAAAADAEIVHDYNYAQVVTLDLIAKGYRYQEVPISYRFRTTGTSFVKLGTYLRAVVPAVYRELNSAGSPHQRHEPRRVGRPT